MADVKIYTSSTGGNAILKTFQAMQSLVSIVIGHDPEVVYVDLDPEARKLALAKSPYKGVVWPLLFANGECVGNYDDVEALNEVGELKPKLVA